MLCVRVKLSRSCCSAPNNKTPISNGIGWKWREEYIAKRNIINTPYLLEIKHFVAPSLQFQNRIGTAMKNALEIRKRCHPSFIQHALSVSLAQQHAVTHTILLWHSSHTKRTWAHYMRKKEETQFYGVHFYGVNYFISRARNSERKTTSK